MAILVPRNFAQKTFLGGALFFLLVLAVTVVLRSGQRESILGAMSKGNPDESYFSGFSETGEGGTRLHLESFHRIEIRDGQPIWEIKAKDAHYFAQELVAHVNDAYVIIHRAPGSVVSVQSKSGRLYMGQKSVEKAELEGDIVVALGESITVQSDFAVYNAGLREVSAPGKVTIKGTGFSVQGIGFEMRVDDLVVKLLDQVESRFDPSAEAPNLDRVAKIS